MLRTLYLLPLIARYKGEGGKCERDRTIPPSNLAFSLLHFFLISSVDLYFKYLCKGIQDSLTEVFCLWKAVPGSAKVLSILGSALQRKNINVSKQSQNQGN